MRSPFAGSFLHLSQNRNSSFFSCAGFLPAKDDPGISSSLRKTDICLPITSSMICKFYPPTPRFHVWPITRPRTAAIYEYGV